MNTATIFKSLPTVVVTGTVSAIAGLTFLPASAVTFSRTSANFSIPDGNTIGNSSTSNVLTSSNLLVTNATDILNNLAHNSINQLRGHLADVPTNTTVTLFNRSGRVVPPTTGTGDNGNSSLKDASTTNIWTVGTSGGNTFNIPPGNYYPTDGNSDNLVAMLNTLGRQQPSDNWTLNVIELGFGVDDNFGETWDLLTKLRL